MNDIATTTQPLDFEKLYKDIARWEGVVRYMYLDTHQPIQLVTVGAGNMLPDVDAALALPFLNTKTNKPATKGEISVAFHKVASMQGRPKAPAPHYKLDPSIEIPESTVKELAVARLKKEFVPGIRKWLVGFDHYPFPAQQA